MAQNNDSPGKRLKREEAKNTLYVNRPDDPRLQMYQDSLAAAIPAILANKQIKFMNTLPMDKRREYYENKFFRQGTENEDKRFIAPISSYLAASRLQDVNKKPYDYAAVDKSVKTKIDPGAGYTYQWQTNSPDMLKSGNYSAIIERGMKEHLPKQKVVYRPEPLIEPLAARQATLVPQEIVAPVMRPAMQSNLEPQDGPMGFALRYPAQNFMNRVKARVTGNPNMPYWVDKEGVKRYPSIGENRPEDVRMAEILKSGLSPNIPEEAVELKRIEMLRKMSPQERKKFMESERIAQQ